MKAIIYLRTSTEEQEPENQKKECLEFAKNRGYDVKEVLLEKISAFKSVERPLYEKVKQEARKGEIQAVIVWALDRWIRNRDTLLEDVTILRNYGCKIHSVKEAWLEAINIEGSLGKTIQEFLLGLIGSIAEMESQRKSERVRNAMIKEKGKPIISYKGNKWGFHSLGNEVDLKIVEEYKNGKSYRIITNEVFYWDKNRNKKFVSLGYVSKIINVHKKLNQNNE